MLVFLIHQQINTKNTLKAPHGKVFLNTHNAKVIDIPHEIYGMTYTEVGCILQKVSKHLQKIGHITHFC
jgi:hypothetical protein